MKILHERTVFITFSVAVNFITQNFFRAREVLKTPLLGIIIFLSFFLYVNLRGGFDMRWRMESGLLIEIMNKNDRTAVMRARAPMAILF